MAAAFIGDVSQFIAGSDSFRDFVSEANRGKDFCFVASLDELGKHLAHSKSRSAIPQVRQ